jgi:hypothetical protein
MRQANSITKLILILLNETLLMETDFPPDGRLAAVDFYDNDTKMSVISYDYTPGSGATCFSIDVNTLEVSDYKGYKAHNASISRGLVLFKLN